MSLRFAVAVAACCVCAQAWAASFTGTVTHVTDGDTLWVRPASGGAPRELRLDGIDAPEGCQPHGEQARAALARRVAGQAVRVTGSRRDAYGRLVARIDLQGQDINAWLVQQGHAWGPRWRREDGPYTADERRARQARRGLWADRAPMEPRVFRQFHGSCTSDRLQRPGQADTLQAEHGPHAAGHAAPEA